VSFPPRRVFGHGPTHALVFIRKLGISLIALPSPKNIWTLSWPKLKLKSALVVTQKHSAPNCCQACIHRQFTQLTNLAPPPSILINDQSAGEFSPNLMISSEDVAGTCMDGIKSLGASLRAFRKAEGGAELIMWKSDIEAAYWNLWLAPEWQIKQTVTVDGHRRHVDHCNCFGNRGSYKVFISFTFSCCLDCRTC